MVIPFVGGSVFSPMTTYHVDFFLQKDLPAEKGPPLHVSDAPGVQSDLSGFNMMLVLLFIISIFHNQCACRLWLQKNYCINILYIYICF